MASGRSDGRGRPPLMTGDNARCGIGAFVSRCRVTWERFQPTGVWDLNVALSSLHSPFLPFLLPHLLPSYLRISPLSHFTSYSPSFIASLFLLFYSSSLSFSVLSSLSAPGLRTFRHLLPEGKCLRPREILALCGATWRSYEVPGTHTASLRRVVCRYSEL